MPLHIELLSPAREDEYDAFLSECPASLLYHSRQYRDVLRRVLDDAAAFYLAAYEGDRLRAVLPTFLKSNPRLGNVLNSLPFFGSHGGVLCAPDTGGADAMHGELFAALGELCRTHSVVASTVITNPFAADSERQARRLGWALGDTRIGQVTPLPTATEADLDEALFRKFHTKTRNSIRKALRSGVRVTHGGSPELLRTLSSLHEANIDALGGIPKPRAFFAALQEIFRYDDDYRVYVASREDRTVAGLLVFFFNQTAEYFIPATAPDARTFQPMSLIVFEAMREAARRGIRSWNWGGTWETQQGVYHFKKRWGALDMPYAYYVDIRTADLLSTPRERLLSEYPYFYVAPFDRLKNVDTAAARN